MSLVMYDVTCICHVFGQSYTWSDKKYNDISMNTWSKFSWFRCFFKISRTFHENQWFPIALKEIWISMIFQELWEPWFHIISEQNFESLACGGIEWNFIQYKSSLVVTALRWMSLGFTNVNQHWRWLCTSLGVYIVTSAWPSVDLGHHWLR